VDIYLKNNGLAELTWADTEVSQEVEQLLLALPPHLHLLLPGILQARAPLLGWWSASSELVREVDSVDIINGWAYFTEDGVDDGVILNIELIFLQRGALILSLALGLLKRAQIRAGRQLQVVFLLADRLVERNEIGEHQVLQGFGAGHLVKLVLHAEVLQLLCDVNESFEEIVEGHRHFGVVHLVEYNI